ncbi:MAG TPA: tetratricopeptide repeat protein [Stellaceae bacterium]|nr:tetratricopeptide repeat protein [Stellaceae bacterium]
MLGDRFGLPVTTSSEPALALYVEAVDRLLSANAGAEALLAEAIALDPDFALAHAALGRNAQLYGRIEEARAAVARAGACVATATERERRHGEAVALAINGDSARALAAVEAQARDYPRDALVLSLALGVYGLIAFSGRPDHHEAQRALLEGLAPSWGQDWWFLTYLGWSRVETDDPRGGGKILERALALNPRNAHGAHARTHARVELGEAAEGIAYLEHWLPDYDPAAILHCHLNWHLALFELDRGEADRAMARYRMAMRPEVARCGPMPTLADAASFLWRCDLYGAGSRPLPWEEVTALVARRFPRAGLAFADLHAAMAEAATSSTAGLEARIADLERRAAEGKLPQGRVVPLLCRGLAAFARGDAAEAADLLTAAMPDLTRVAGSHAQREVFEDTLIAALLGCGRSDGARRLLAQRLARRPRRQDATWTAAAAPGSRN